MGYLSPTSLSSPGRGAREVGREENISARTSSLQQQQKICNREKRFSLKSEFEKTQSDSVRPHRQQPTKLSRPWDSPAKNSGVGYHFLLQCIKVKRESEVAQSCPTLSDPMECSLPRGFPCKSTGVGCHCLLRPGKLVEGQHPSPAFNKSNQWLGSGASM